MRTFSLNPNVTAFYFGGDCEPEKAILADPNDYNWTFGCCESLGLIVHAIHNRDSAIVYDTMCTVAQAREVRDYLEKHLNIRKITVVLSHWHLGHVGGNALYRDCNIVASRKAREELLRHKAGIESGEFWGNPAINPLQVPDIVFEDALSIFLGDLEVQLYNCNIHSEDSVFIYLPQYKMLLPGDMLEDTAPFIAEPADIPAHLENYTRLRAFEIDKIAPCHGRSSFFQQGGYSRELIDAVTYYLSTLYEQLGADPEAEVADLRLFMADYLERGIIAYWAPYDLVHSNNINKMRNFFRGNKNVGGKLYAGDKV